MWDRAYEDWWWLDRYGLTPQQVDAMPAGTVARIPDIAAMADKYRAEEQERRQARGV